MLGILTVESSGERITDIGTSAFLGSRGHGRPAFLGLFVLKASGFGR